LRTDTPDLLALVEDLGGEKHANEKNQRQTERIQALHTIDIAITGSTDFQVALNIILQQAMLHLKMDAAVILVYEPSMQILKYGAGQGLRTEALQYTALRVGEGYAGMAAMQKQIVRAPDLQNDQYDLPRSMEFANEGFMSYYCVPLIAKGGVKGVMESFHRSHFRPDDEWLEFFETLGGQAAIALDNAMLFKDLQRSNLELTLAYDTTLEGWSKALDMRDKDAEGHTQRVAEMTERLAVKFNIKDADRMHIRRGAILHDIGKMGIPDSILLKEGPLTEDEWKIMRRHPTLALDFLSSISYLRLVLDIPYCHHEKWDGSGYPRGLKGEQIPLAARIFAIVDVFDALTSDRPYRHAWSVQQALEYINAEKAKHFDPEVVEVFMREIANNLSG
jgi:HD-GYP domain-containing protein (c-di-GMP phosphodiesterase class II)